LGRDERKWLSHFDFTVISQFDDTRSKADLQSILDSVLSNADALLAAAKKDQRNISQSLKMTDAETVLGKDDDDRLENLRWYVYPKECALLLTNPKADELLKESEISGAINPFGTHSNGTCELGVVEVDRKRSSETLSVDPAAQIETSSLLPFRDGDYAAEATLEEIMRGVEDGELSEKCQIFDQRIGEWLSYSEFESSTKRVKTDILPIDIVENQTIKIEKKAPRHSEAWGKGEVVVHSAGDVADNMDVESDLAKTSVPRETVEKKKRFKHTVPPPKLMRLVIQAIIQWEMIEEGDRLLLGLSGGKDSLSLLHCLLEFKRKHPINFDLEVCTIDPMTPSFDPSPLIPYVESLGLKYHYIRDDIVSRASISGKNGKMVRI